ncbi:MULTISPECIES: LysM peptidoglycan-binding domain-containing protein [unclassified Actinobaculum]|uniref:LysM peptidoglycan-binding domain-containing protein n=1 Tax=unclassified Actinobaculum TaxID=2609299 RepID=UPI000D5290EE|nr:MULTISPECIES: LysM peptidoglycan-binding domain-containing protein [unclassified Actinobaculum]AWE42612.1 hypothetical protein DDD63_07465 [Actinobaculum sp. 313]RTE47948.1 LysM peptidoglycan-binding domain-containing protein [Actinobaculum sp. 352]
MSAVAVSAIEAAQAKTSASVNLTGRKRRPLRAVPTAASPLESDRNEAQQAIPSRLDADWRSEYPTLARRRPTVRVAQMEEAWTAAMRPSSVRASEGRGRAAPVTAVGANSRVRHAHSVNVAHMILALRLAFGALAAAALVVLGLGIGSLFVPAPGDSVVVQSGDTLWSIAATLPDAPDTATAVADIKAQNGLTSDAIAVGQVLELPRY